MSSLHPDRLTAAPRNTSSRATGTATVKTPSTTSRQQRRGTLPTATATETPARRTRAARTVTATAARTATTSAARTASATAKATAKAAATGARAATTRAASVRATAAARKPATAKPAAPKAAAAEPATAKATAPKAATVKATAPEAATTKAIATKATAKKSTKAPALKVTTAEPATAEPASAEPATAQAGSPAAEDVGLPTVGRRSRTSASVLLHCPAPVRRRPSLFLAAALAAVIGLGGGVSAAGPTAQADTRTASATVSVAEQLGIPEQPAAAPIVDAETTDRLGELVASRAERDAEQAAAADTQADADRAAEEAARLAAEAAAEAARPEAVAPVQGARLTSGFGARWGTLHAGIDLAAPMRTPEYAVMDGVVLEAGPASGFGLAVYIQHENGDVTVYGHMDEILVSAGQVVQAGDTIALLGNRGQSTGPHLHFEVHQGGLQGTKIDPVPWLAAHGVQV